VEGPGRGPKEAQSGHADKRTGVGGRGEKDIVEAEVEVRVGVAVEAESDRIQRKSAEQPRLKQGRDSEVGVSSSRVHGRHGAGPRKENKTQ
jgi:hypothetical protein